MITSWVDLAGAALLMMIGLYHLRRGEARALGRGGRWRADIGALLSSVLGGVVVAMGAALLLYSVSFAAISEGLLSR